MSKGFELNLDYIVTSALAKSVGTYLILMYSRLKTCIHLYKNIFQLFRGLFKFEIIYVLMILRFKISVLSLFYNLENWEIHIEFIKSNIKTLKA